MRLFLLAAVIACSVTSADSETRELDWSDLVDPSVQEFEDPFRDLTFDQIEDLRSVVGLRSRLSGADLADTDRTTAEDRLAMLEARLASGDIDIEWMLSQRWVVAERREASMTSGNPDVDGRSITLSGFAIPAPPSDDGTQAAYLVPERGMCSHTPPPSPNQMVRVQLTGDWQPKMMHEPVRVTGRIAISPSEESMLLVDGFVAMRATFLLEAEQVTTVEELLDQTAKPDKAWIARIQEIAKPEMQ